MLQALGLQHAQVPLLLPGVPFLVPLAPRLTSDDRKAIDNVSKMAAFLMGGDASRPFASANPINGALNECLPCLVDRFFASSSYLAVPQGPSNPPALMRSRVVKGLILPSLPKPRL